MSYAKPGHLCDAGETLPETCRNLIDALDDLKEQFSLDSDIPAADRITYLGSLDDRLGKLEQRLLQLPPAVDHEDITWLEAEIERFGPPHMLLQLRDGQYGFVLNEEELAEEVHDGEILKVSDLSEVPADYFGEVLHINDHGNLTLYWKCADVELKELWAIV